MTLVIGAKCSDGVVLAADRRRLARSEIGPEATKLFALECGIALAGAGDDAVLNEARLFIDRRVETARKQSPDLMLFDIVETTASVVNELVGYYRDRVEEPFGFVLAGIENLSNGDARLYTVFGAGLSDVPWACLGLGSTYARPLVDLLLARGDLSTEEAAKVMPTIFSLVSSVQSSVGGGVDICTVKDVEGVGPIAHHEEVALDRLRASILRTLNVKSRQFNKDL